MLFNSLPFLVLLAVTLPLYYLPLPGKWSKVWQVLLLLAASALFYAWEEPRLLILLGFSCVMNAVLVERIIYHQRVESGKAKPWMVGGVIANLALLAFFKYAGILLGILPHGLIPQEAVAWVRSIPLPIGISFYTFHALSLLIDVHRRHVSGETRARLGHQGARRASSFADLSLYIIFFPQLVAGPIVKARNFIDQIREKIWTDIDWVQVRRYLVAGYFLKIFVADNLAEQTAMLTIGPKALAESDPVNLMALLYGYGFQIFADFAGYSLIAIGLGIMFGYRLPENFDFPYLSRSITEFWRRWHLSLSAWLRDYLYIPLGGNRKGSGRTYLNLFLVMFLGGLWHGAEWKFALWGTLHGVFLAIERFLTRRRGKIEDAPVSAFHSIAGWIYTFHAVTLLWLTFLMPDMASIRAFFTGLASGKFSMPGQPLFSLAVYGGPVIAYHLWGWLKEHRPGMSGRLTHPLLEATVHAAMVFLVITNPGAPRGFIYFQF
ncbi:MBOAT family protein [Luteolibacter sp. Populi]|uniref:MBOAT family O-acyltransferase n=1 Tax=Luteolibacter sp. Populi TaxID=3230487 RepID=UPI0034655836